MKNSFSERREYHRKAAGNGDLQGSGFESSTYGDHVRRGASPDEQELLGRCIHISRLSHARNVRRRRKVSGPAKTTTLESDWPEVSDSFLGIDDFIDAVKGFVDVARDPFA
jgi:hypothetical protein